MMNSRVGWKGGKEKEGKEKKGMEMEGENEEREEETDTQDKNPKATALPPPPLLLVQKSEGKKNLKTAEPREAKSSQPLLLELLVLGTHLVIKGGAWGQRRQDLNLLRVRIAAPKEP